MFASSFFAVLFLAALNANALVTGIDSNNSTLPACGIPDDGTSTDVADGQSTTALTAAVGTTTDVASSTSSAILAATTSAAVVVQVVEVEVISFFTFVINLGGALPPSVLSSPGEGNFLVFEEEFIELAPACSRACNHQFKLCTSSAAAPHATFVASDCKSQEDNCLGVATTQTSTASEPSTLKATATVVHARSSAGGVSATAAVTTSAAATTTAPTTTADTAAAAGATTAPAAVGGSKAAAVDNVKAGGECVSTTLTVTVTASASPSVVARRAERIARADRRAASGFA